MVLAEITQVRDNDCMTPQRIRAIRKSLKLSQENFAVLLGTGPTSVGRWESGMTEPIGGYRILLELVERGIYPDK